MATDKKEYPYDNEFPENVNPTDKNRREFSKKREKEVEDAKRDAEEASERE
jgi:hypothetical protein